MKPAVLVVGAGSIGTRHLANLKDIGVDFEMVAPKNNKTKTTASYFKQLTGWIFYLDNAIGDAEFRCQRE